MLTVEVRSMGGARRCPVQHLGRPLLISDPASQNPLLGVHSQPPRVAFLATEGCVVGSWRASEPSKEPVVAVLPGLS